MIKKTGLDDGLRGIKIHIDDLVQGCSIPSALVMEIL